MRILYLSVHAILENYEVSLFHELGYEVFSPGSYIDPQHPGDPARPAIPGMQPNHDLIRQYHEMGRQCPGQDAKGILSQEFLDNFDVVIVMHQPRWITEQWHVLKRKRVIWRTIGQSVQSVEAGLELFRNKGLKIVRYSPNEANIPGFIGQDALIRFPIDETIFRGYTGTERSVITFSQSMEQRGTHCGYGVFERVTRGLPRKLFGPQNDQPGFGMGKISFEQQLEEYRKNQVYFYTGTHPASYTLNFMEAWSIGAPIVALGPYWGNGIPWRDHNLYEIPTLIHHGVDGFFSDDEAELRRIVEMLLDDPDQCRRIGDAGRLEAIRHFNKDMIRLAWKAFLEKVA